MLLRPAVVRAQGGDASGRVSAELAGEPIDPGRHELVADVKAVTLYDLRVEQTPEGWRARVTLDI